MNLSPDEVKAMLVAGLIYASERTKDGVVTCYALTGRGRILLGNRLRVEPNNALALAAKTS